MVKTVPHSCFKKLCFWYDPSQKAITFSKLATESTRARFENCSKFRTKTQERRQWHMNIFRAMFLLADFQNDLLYICLGIQILFTGRLIKFRSSRPEVFLRKGVLKIYSKFTGERPCRSAVSTKLQQLYWNSTSAWLL